ncbi:putative transporter [compost metagenome]
MIVTVVTVVATSNLSIGVGIGVLLSALVFAWKIARIRIMHEEADEVRTYRVSGQMFFGTVTNFLSEFDPANDPEKIVIDFSKSHVWDHSAANAISKVIFKYRQVNKEVVITGLNEESAHLVERMGLS